MNLHYVAGIVDGEGWIGIKRTGKNGDMTRIWARDCWYSPSIKVCQSEKGKLLIDMLQKEFGGFVSKRVHPKITENNSYEWCIRGNKSILPFLKKIIDKLILKREQAKIVIDFYLKSEQRYMPRLSEKEFNRRENLYLSIKKLNSRGVAETK